ncbi:MAG: hypothetical protein K2N06_03610 [Oscillospiraceae bacterium]|nr:hypothetical protein [Oscillospiraceae bacterium]
MGKYHKNWREVLYAEVFVFSTFDIKKIRRFIRKNAWYYGGASYLSNDDFHIMRDVCYSLIVLHGRTIDIHILVQAAVWFTTNSLRIPYVF